MRDRTFVPVKVVNGVRWGDLAAISHAHEICGESVKRKEENFTFAGQHRVRLYVFKKNVHWRPLGQELDISAVVPDVPPRRNQQR